MSLNGGINEKSRYEKKADKLQKFFVRPSFLSLSIGIPFCIFKMLFGLTAVRIGSPSNLSLIVFGWVVIGWSGADILMNTGRVILDIFHQPARFEYCTIAQLGRIFRVPMVFLAIDTLLSFLIICFMLWSGWITKLTPFEIYLWYSATTLNLITLSTVSLYNEIKEV